jgi:CRISPR-associated endoribonuclease Cas6
MGLVLIGRAIQSLPIFVAAFEEFGRRGFHRGEGRFQMAAMQEWKTDEPCGEPFGEEQSEISVLRFLTPTRFEVNHKTVSELPFSLFFSFLLRRIRNLQHFYHEPPSCVEDVHVGDAPLLERAKTMTLLGHDWVWFDQARRSHGRWMPQGGWVGDVQYRGDIAPFLPFLKLGERVHVGKGTSFGMGRFEIRGIYGNTGSNI